MDGIPYFPLDVCVDDKIELIEAEFELNRIISHSYTTENAADNLTVNSVFAHYITSISLFRHQPTISSGSSYAVLAGITQIN